MVFGQASGVKVDRITPDLSEPRAVLESRALRRLAERSYPQAEGHPWPTADSDRWVTTSLVGHPDVLKVDSMYPTVAHG